VLILIEILDLIKGERKPPAQTVINLSDDDNLPRREDRHHCETSRSNYGGDDDSLKGKDRH
jgi:hypothetical protein